MSKVRFSWLSLACLGVISFSAELTAKPPSKPNAVATVVSEVLTPISTQSSLSLVGHLSSPQSVLLTAKVTSTIESIRLTDNANIKKNTVLVTLDDRHAQAQYDEALALYNDAQRQFSDRQRLLKRGAVTESEVEAQQTQVAMLKARLSAAKATLDDHQIRAPFHGQVGLMNLVVGQSIKAGDGLITLENRETLRLDLSVPEQHWSKLSIGMSVSATSDAWPDDYFMGKIVALNSGIDPNSLSVTARVVFDNAEHRLAAGMLMSATLTLDPISQPTIPMSSVYFDGESRFVYRIDEAGIAHQILVKTGTTIGNRFVVNQGVDFGDRVVVKGLVKIKDGMKVVDSIETKGAQI
jgi:RND family efflux transporter MFP subunit